MAEQAMIEEMARAISKALEDFGVYDRHTKAAQAAYDVVKKAEEEKGRRAWEYYQATTCACTAAERYVPGCSKHGVRATLTKGDTDHDDR